MISNDQQLAIVARQRDDLESWRDELLHDSQKDALDLHITVTGVEKMIARLQREIDAYKNAKAGKLPPVLTARVREEYLGEVAEALIQLRVAKGLRQEDVAQLVGKQQPSIARWEDEEYYGYTLKELSKLAAALGRELHVSFVVPATEVERQEPADAAAEARPALAVRE